MSLNESIVEDAALILPAATLTRQFASGYLHFLSAPLRSGSHGEKEKRESIRCLNPMIPKAAP